MSLYRFNGSQKTAEISISNNDYEQIAADKATEVVNQILEDNGYIRLIHKGTNTFPKLDLSNQHVYKFLIKGYNSNCDNHATTVALSSRSTATLYHRRIEAFGTPVSFLTGNTTDKELLHGVINGRTGNMAFTVEGVISLVPNGASSALIQWKSSGRGGDWLEVGASEFGISNYTIPSGTLSIYKHSSNQGGAISTCQVWQIS